MKPQFSHFLLDILHVDQQKPVVSQLSQLSTQDWQIIVDEAIYFRLTYQLQSFLTTGAQIGSSLPKACHNQLAETVRATLMHNLGQQHQLHKILLACRDADVPVMLLKGLWLTEVVYGDLKARNSGDIDLMLHPQDMPKFLKIARESGLTTPVSDGDMVELMRLQNEIPLYADNKPSFDIHWSFTRPGEENPIDEARLWQRAEYSMVAGVPCSSLCLEDHLLYLCFHTALHHHFLYVGPRALLDVAKMINRPPRPIEWDYFLDSAQDLGWQRGVGLTLELVRVHLGVSPPLAIMQVLNPTCVDAAVTAAALDALFSGQEIHDSLTPNIVRMLDERSWRKKLLVLMARVCPSSETIESMFKQHDPHASIYSLYVKHWQRLVKDHAGKLLNLLFGGRQQHDELQRAKLLKNWLDL
jgi:hypothetical protein